MAIKSSLKKSMTQASWYYLYYFVPLKILLLGLFWFCPSAFAKKSVKTFKIDRNITAEPFLLLSSKCSPFDLSKAPLPYLLKQFHFYWGTREGRKHTLHSLKNLLPLQRMIEQELEFSKLPAFLKAIPIVETGYTNYRPPKNSDMGAGVWMLTKGTARYLGLRINQNIDERRNIELETKAALKLLSSHYQKLQDWFLVLLAYNRGAYALKKSITKLNSKDPWLHIDNHHENDPGYLGKIISTVILMNCPKLLE